MCYAIATARHDLLALQAQTASNALCAYGPHRQDISTTVQFWAKKNRNWACELDLFRFHTNFRFASHDHRFANFWTMVYSPSIYFCGHFFDQFWSIKLLLWKREKRESICICLWKLTWSCDIIGNRLDVDQLHGFLFYHVFDGSTELDSKSVVCYEIDTARYGQPSKWSTISQNWWWPTKFLQWASS